MHKLKKDVWKKAGWERGSQLESGVQGHAHLARKSTDPQGEYNYVLKKLKRQNDADRRAMFCAEVRAMGVLDHGGVVALEDTNAEDFREPVELYLVTRRIVGQDLESLVNANSLSIFDAIRVVSSVLQIIDHCHRRSVVHRDIKPCHVILRDNSLNTPVLIDFGLAYHEESQPTDAATEEGQGRGNRFLIGPEHLSRNADSNRSHVTDVCQCIGLLFFALTQKYPGILRDERGKKPHQRLELNDILSDVDPWRTTAMTEIFDVGFEWDPYRRWYSIDRLLARLQTITESQAPSDTKFALELDEIFRKAEAGSITPDKLRLAKEMTESVLEVTESLVQQIKEKSGEYLSVSTKQSQGQGAHIASNLITFQNQVERGKSKAFTVQVTLSDSNQIEIHLIPYNGNLRVCPSSKSVCLAKYDLDYAEVKDDVQPIFASSFSMCLEDALGIEKD